MVDEQRRVRVLAFAYACEPGHGSEGGAGWGVVRALQAFGDCTVICGPEAGSMLGVWTRRNPDSSLQTEVVPEPLWAPALRRSRVGEFLIYLVWQRSARRVGQRLVERGTFDVVVHATMSAFWLPSVAVDFGLPTVWGPVGGAVTTPMKLWPLLGWRGTVVELVDLLAVRIMSLLPSTRRTWRKATVHIAQNRDTLERLPRDVQPRVVVLNHAVFHEADLPVDDQTGGAQGDYVAWVSSMESRKGPELAVRALAMTRPGIRMVMAGDGPERTRMEALAKQLGVQSRIEFVGRVARERALEIMARSAVAVFTGMREEGGLALAETMLLGARVVVLANGGAAAIAESATDASRVSLVEPAGPSETVAAMAAAIEHQIGLDRSVGVRERSPLIDQDAAISELARLVSVAATDRSTVPSTPEIVPTQSHERLRAPTRQRGGDDPLLTIVMPAYNAEEYIERAIDSILAQTFEGFELIVYVDVGNDRTLEIAERYAGLDDRVRVLASPELRGMCVALNRAIATARGSYIGRMDADDIADPTRFEKLVGALAGDPETVVVGSNAVHINRHDEVLGLSIAGPADPGEFRALRAEGEITMVLDGTAAFRKDVFDAAGGYDPEMSAAPEVDLHTRMAAYGIVVSVQEPLLMYRLHPGSSVATQFFEGRSVHRYVEAREKAILRGDNHVPSFQEFLEHEQDASRWQRGRIRREDFGQFHYRAAGVLLSEGRKGAAIVSLSRAFVRSPQFVVRRVWQRRFSPEARERLRSVSIAD